MAFSGRILPVVETALNATIHYQRFTSPACRDCREIVVSPDFPFFSRCRDAVLLSG